MLKFKNRNIVEKSFLVIIYSIIYSIGLQLFIQPANIITTGIAGLVQIIVQQIPALKYGIIYFLLNVPGIIVGVRYLGGKFTFFSILSILTVSISTMLIPIPTGIEQITQDRLLNSIFGGILLGYSIGSLLKIGASSGGTDFFAMYLLKYKNIEFSKVNLILNMAIIGIGILFNDLEMGLFTIVSLYIRNLIIDQVFTNTQTITLFIIGENLDEINEFINSKLHRGSTTIKKAVGGYTHKEKEIVMATVNMYEYSIFLDEIDEFKETIFVNVMDTKQIVGNYKLSKEKNAE